MFQKTLLHSSPPPPLTSCYTLNLKGIHLSFDLYWYNVDYFWLPDQNHLAELESRKIVSEHPPESPIWLV